MVLPLIVPPRSCNQGAICNMDNPGCLVLCFVQVLVVILVCQSKNKASSLTVMIIPIDKEQILIPDKTGRNKSVPYRCQPTDWRSKE